MLDDRVVSLCMTVVKYITFLKTGASIKEALPVPQPMCRALVGLMPYLLTMLTAYVPITSANGEEVPYSEVIILERASSDSKSNCQLVLVTPTKSYRLVSTRIGLSVKVFPHSQ